MPSQKNIALLQEATVKVEKAVAMFFVDYSGLTHQQLEEARRQLQDNNSEIAIFKNTLMNIALRSKNLDVRKRLQGPQATLFSYDDPIKTAKILDTFFKKYLPAGRQVSDVIKFGVFSREAGFGSAGEGWEIIDSDFVLRLASIPTKDVLLGKLVGLLKSPISNLVYNLDGNIQKLVLTLKAIEKSKSN